MLCSISEIQVYQQAVWILKVFVGGKKAKQTKTKKAKGIAFMPMGIRDITITQNTKWVLQLMITLQPHISCELKLPYGK